jgi:hypothetical protein
LSRASSAVSLTTTKQPGRISMWSDERRAGVAGYNHSLKRRLTVCCSCSKSAAGSPALVAVFVDPLEIDGSASPNRPHYPVPPILSGRDQAPPNFLIENP